MIQKNGRVKEYFLSTCGYIYKWFGERKLPDSSNSVSSSSIEILLQLDFLKDNLALFKCGPLKPFMLEDTMGITKTEDALIESSPKPTKVLKKHNTQL